MDLEDIVAVHVEAIEVIINHILYIRGVYPPQIFKKRRAYNTPVFMNAFPTLNSYLSNILKTVRQLLQTEAQELKLEVIIYGNEDEPMENYMFHVQPVKMKERNFDQYLIEYEQQLRSALYKLAERVKQLPKLNKNCKFKVHIHTTQTAFTRLSQNAQYQEFPWLQATENMQQLETHNVALLPLVAVDKLGLKLKAHIHKLS